MHLFLLAVSASTKYTVNPSISTHKSHMTNNNRYYEMVFEDIFNLLRNSIKPSELNDSVKRLSMHNCSLRKGSRYSKEQSKFLTQKLRDKNFLVNYSFDLNALALKLQQFKKLNDALIDEIYHVLGFTRKNMNSVQFETKENYKKRKQTVNIMLNILNLYRKNILSRIMLQKTYIDMLDMCINGDSKIIINNRYKCYLIFMKHGIDRKLNITRGFINKEYESGILPDLGVSIADAMLKRKRINIKNIIPDNNEERVTSKGRFTIERVYPMEDDETTKRQHLIFFLNLEVCDYKETTYINYDLL